MRYENLAMELSRWSMPYDIVLVMCVSYWSEWVYVCMFLPAGLNQLGYRLCGSLSVCAYCIMYKESSACSFLFVLHLPA
jgi:hypothetical protein